MQVVELKEYTPTAGFEAIESVDAAEVSKEAPVF
jgi:hypothetical protein